MSGRRAGALSLLPAPDAPAGSRPAGLYCHLARFPCIHLDATALAGHAETGIRRTAFWEGHLTERIHFDSGSSFDRLGIAFNQMADNINALIASKKQLIDGIAHELRTPLVRLRYRTEMSENLTGAESQALNRDIGQLEALIEELLTYARLDRPQTELHLSTPDLPVWLQTHINDVQSVNPQRKLLTAITPGTYGALDMRLMERVLDNLMNNAMRYSETTLRIGLDLQGSRDSVCGRRWPRH